MWTCVRRGEAACERRIETEPPMVSRGAQDKDDFPPASLSSRQALPDQKAPNAGTLPIRQDRDRSESQSPKLGRHSRKHDMSDDNVIIDRNQRYLGVALGSQLIDQLGFRRHWEGCFDDRADGRTVSQLFGTNDHAGTLSNPQARRHRPPPGK